MMDLLIIKYEPFLRDVSAEVTVKAFGPFAELEALINIRQTFKERYHKDFIIQLFFDICNDQLQLIWIIQPS